MINLEFTKNKTYYVVGIGKSNRAVIKALQKSGAEVRIWDDNPDNLQRYDDKLIRTVDKAPWSKIKAVIMAPGISPSHEIVRMANDKNIPVICDVDLYAQSLPKSKIIGVTGTNGKSTVTALIHHILNHDGKSQMGGNIGVPVMNLKNRCDYTVLELSSYQLDRSPNLKCDVAILLNITPDHLEWHGDMDGYIEAKSKIFNHADVKIISIDDDYSKYVFDAQDTAQSLTVYNDDLPFSPSDFPKLKGTHNLQNILAAYYACRSLDVEHDLIIEQIKTFNGLNHRQYMVRAINGVPYINDSKATNADASRMALQSYNNIFWIAGGLAKDGGIESLENILNNIQKAYLYGDAANDFAKFLSVRGVDVSTFDKLEDALSLAHKDAQDTRGEPTGSPTVLLSPACASFDQFQSFEDRGDHFTKLVEGLDDG